MAQFDGLQAGEQAALLFVEQAVEKQNSGIEFLGRYLESGRIGDQRNRLGGLPGAESRAWRPSAEVYRNRPATSERRRRSARTKSWRGSWTSTWRMSASSSANQPRGD
jgi:hypothetical protein